MPAPSPSKPVSEAFPGGIKRFIFPIIFVFALFIVLFYRLVTPPTTAAYWHIRGPIFGTTFSIKIVTPKTKGQTQIKQSILSTLETINQQMSTYRTNSELSQFNRSRLTTPFPASKALVEVVANAQQIAKLTRGAFDVTIGPIVNIWGFGPQKRIRPPSPAQMTAVQAHVGHQKLSFDRTNNTLQKQIPGLYVDLSAIAKGYAVDALAQLLNKHAFNRYIIEIGGEVRTKGRSPRGKYWRVGIEKPSTHTQKLQLVIQLHNAAMATSGNYRNYMTVDGKRVSHLIDPRTSQPVPNHLASVSVIHANCMTADALATALFVLGPQKGLAFATQQKIKALFLIPQGQDFIQKSTPAFAALQRSLKPSKKETP